VQLKVFLLPIPDIKNQSYQKVIVNDETLNGSDSLNMRCILKKREEPIKYDTNSNYSQDISKKFSLFSLKEIEPFEEDILNMKFVGNFLIKNETRYLPFNQQANTNEELNFILNSKNNHMTVCISWKASIFENDVFVRVAFGQHFVQLKHLFES
jgi:hypothetical protein